MLTVDRIVHETNGLLEQLGRPLADDALAEVERIEAGVCRSIVMLTPLPLAPRWKSKVDVPISIRYDYRRPIEVEVERLRRPW